jgi:excisionase family DNA binding protein
MQVLSRPSEDASRGLMFMPSIKIAMSADEAADAAGIGRTQIFEEIRQKRLIARKIGRRTIIATDDLKAWLNGLPKARAEQQGQSS